MKKVIFACCAMLALAAFSPKQISPAVADDASINNSGTPLSAYLLGSNEVPNTGDPDGEGWAELSLNQGQGTITFMLRVEGIETARAAHIHRAGAGMPGPVVVPLSAPSGGMSSGVALADKALIKEIRQNPERFYVNVHNAVYPGGALRGQLYK